MIEVEFKKLHFVVTFRALQGIIAKGQEDEPAPGVKIQQDPMPGSVYSFMKDCVSSTVVGVEVIVSGHFEMFFRDMLDKKAL